MGDPKRARKKYETPSHPWWGERIAEETKLQREYALKNKREIWRFRTILRGYRARARECTGLRGEVAEKQSKELISKLYRLGVLKKKDSTLDDVLSLGLKDFLERRLQTIVFRKGMAHSMKHSRQLITHGHVSVRQKKVLSPNYIVEINLEPTVSFSPISKISASHPSIPIIEEKAKVEGKSA